MSSTTTTAPSDLATSILTRLPALLDASIKHELANSLLAEQCAALEARIVLVQESIELERKKQGRVRAQLARFAPSDDSLPVVLRRAPTKLQLIDVGPPLPSLLSQIYQEKEKENVDEKEESPVSLRTKRKGVVFSDDVQIRVAKRVKLAHSSSTLGFR